MPGDVRPDAELFEDDAALDQWYEDFTRKQLLKSGGRGARAAQTHDEAMQRVSQFQG